MEAVATEAASRAASRAATPARAHGWVEKRGGCWVVSAGVLGGCGGEGGGTFTKQFLVMLG